jgi:hypothetical protein
MAAQAHQYQTEAVCLVTSGPQARGSSARQRVTGEGDSRAAFGPAVKFPMWLNRSTHASGRSVERVQIRIESHSSSLARFPDDISPQGNRPKQWCRLVARDVFGCRGLLPSDQVV